MPALRRHGVADASLLFRGDDLSRAGCSHSCGPAQRAGDPLSADRIPLRWTSRLLARDVRLLTVCSGCVWGDSGLTRHRW